MSPLRWILAQIRADRWPVALFALSVAVAVALACLVPRITGDLSSRAMSGAFEGLSAQQGDLVARWREAPEGDPDPAGAHLRAAEAIRAAQPLPLRDILRPPQLVAEFGFPLVVTPPSDSGFHRLTFAVLVDATLQDHAEIVAGSWPAPPDPSAPVSDIVVLHDTAERLGWVLGGEPLPGLRLAGTFRPRDPDDRRWEQVPRGVRYAELVDPNLGTELVSAVFLDRGALSVGVSGRRPQINQRLWFGIDGTALAPGEADAGLLADQLTAMLSRGHALDEEGGLTLRFFSDLGEVLDSVGVQQRTLLSLVLVLATGPLAISLLLVSLAAAGIREARSGVTGLLRSRGLSPFQLLAWTASEGACLGLLGGVVALSTLEPVLPGSVAAWPVCLTFALILGGLLPMAHVRRPGMGVRRDLGAGRGRARVAAELGLVALAVVSVVLLFDRPTTGGVEAFAGAAPALVTLAAGVLLWRLHPLVLRGLARALGRGRGLAGTLGVLRALRGPGGGAVPLVAVLLGVSMAVLGGVLSASLNATSSEAAWAVNGAAIRVAGPRMTDDAVARIGAVDGVAAVARLTRVADSVPLMLSGGDTVHLDVWSVDQEANHVYRGTPLDPRLQELVVDANGPTPVVLGGTAAAASGPAVLDGVGDVTIVGHRDLLPGAGTPAAWAIVDARQWAAAGGDPGTSTLALVSLDDGAGPGRVAADLREQLGTAVVTTVDDQLRGRHDPASRAFTRTVTLAGAATLLLMTLAVVGADSLAEGARRGSLHLLRALGVTLPEIRRSVAWEVAPGLILALIGGVPLGIGVAGLLLAGLDYSFITGARSASLVVDPASLGVVVGLVLAAFAVIVVSAARRTTLQREVP